MTQIVKQGPVTACNLRAPHLYPQGIQALAEHLAEGLTIRRPVWVGRVQPRVLLGAQLAYQGLVWDVHGERDKVGALYLCFSLCPVMSFLSGPGVLLSLF